MALEKIMVRVKDGHRLYENGATRLPGQTFWIWPSRLKDLEKEVDVVKGAVPPMRIQTTAMEQPAPGFQTTGIPSPQTRMKEPRPLTKKRTKVKE